MAEVQKKNGWTTTMRWAARLIGLAAAGLFVAFLVISGSFVLSEMDWASPQGLPLVLAVVVAVAGVLVAWRWELVGGLMAMAGSVAIMGLVCAGSGMDMLYCAFLFTLPLLLAGALYLGCCARKRVTQEA
jgi:membrane protease YdiL (CAAX protease family)